LHPFLLLLFCYAYITGACILQVIYRREPKILKLLHLPHNFNVAYVVKFFGPSRSLTVENKPNKVRTRFFRFSAVSHVLARRAITPAANSLSLRPLAGCHRSQLAGGSPRSGFLNFPLMSASGHLHVVHPIRVWPICARSASSRRDGPEQFAAAHG
jgi:hypothetical protein